MCMSALGVTINGDLNQKHRYHAPDVRALIGTESHLEDIH